jgi:hypothetical protein
LVTREGRQKMNSRQYAAVRHRKIQRALESEAANQERSARRIAELFGLDEDPSNEREATRIVEAA